MLVQWTVQYRGSDPANCRRKVARALEVQGRDERYRTWVNHTYLVEFFSELQADEWGAARAELLDSMATLCPWWEIWLGVDALSASSSRVKIKGVESVSCNLNKDQQFRSAIG
ncbi:hypothetical protein [Andreprevotia lacus]|nr:hypothetical protein [Andreprevotia lacus]